MKKSTKYKDIDYVAYDLYVNYKNIQDRILVLPIDLFVEYNKHLSEDTIKMSIYYDNAKIELRKRKLKQLYEKN